MGAFQRRKSLLLKYANIKKDVGLEFGPLAHPLIKKNEGKIKYADYLDKASLIKRYASSRNPDEIVEIDYIIKPEESLSNSIPEKFNYLIACHVIEHVPNIIDWLLQLHKLLLPKGYLHLVIPDKRYTFDILRPPTPLSHILDDYYRNVQTAELDHIYEHIFVFRDIKADDIWQGQLSEHNMKTRYSAPNAYSAATKELNSGKYVEVHCHVFTSEQFMTILKTLIDMGILPFTICAFDDVINPYNEFIVLLQKK